MKIEKMLMVLLSLIVLVFFTTGATAQTPKPEKPAAPEKASPSSTETPKAETGAKQAKASKFIGTVVTYNAGKLIKVKSAQDQEMTFGVTRDTQIKGGDIKQGGRVIVVYESEAGKNMASTIMVPPPKSTPKAKKEKTT